MMNLSVTNVFLFLLITWGTNSALNLLYVLKLFVPSVARWDMPIDGGIVFFDKKRLIGDSTTLFGVVVALLCSLGALASGIFTSTVALVAPLLVYTGHMLGSFIKRRMDKNETFVPFIDHGDYVLVSGFVLVLTGSISWQLALMVLLFTYILHPLATLGAFKLGLREHPY